MNRSIRWVTAICAAMFFALLAQLSFNYVVRSDDLIGHPQNRRVRDAEFANPRGSILVSNTPIAETVDADGRFARMRVYSDGAMYAPVTGYFSYIFGFSGLEQRFNSQLTGTDDSQFLGSLFDSLAGRHPEGASLQTTLNPAAQRAAWDALAGRKGAVVAMDYSTGAILAYVSSPSFDPNALSSTDIAATQEAWRGYLEDAGNPLADRATAEIYAPGSVFKLVTAAAAFTDGMSPETVIDAPPEFQLPNSSHILTNWGPCGSNGQITIREALVVSCNTAIAKLAIQLGDDKLRSQAEAFGFGSAFGGDLNSAVSTFPKELDDAQLAMSGIGQYDVAATPLQIAALTAAIANGGVQMEPYLVSEIREPDLSVLSRHNPTELRTSLSDGVAEQLRSVMMDVITRGTAVNANVPGLTMGGKTGTAQNDPSRPPYAWFTGWSVNPNVVVTVFIEDAVDNEDLISGGRNAAPVGRAVFEALR